MTGREDHPIVNLQISEMYYQIQIDASDKRWWDYSALFKTRNARSRLICVMGMAFFGQWYEYSTLLILNLLRLSPRSLANTVILQVWQQCHVLLSSCDDGDRWNRR